MAINKFKYRYRFVTTLDFGGIGWGDGGISTWFTWAIERGAGLGRLRLFRGPTLTQPEFD